MRFLAGIGDVPRRMRTCISNCAIIRPWITPSRTNSGVWKPARRESTSWRGDTYPNLSIRCIGWATRVSRALLRTILRRRARPWMTRLKFSRVMARFETQRRKSTNDRETERYGTRDDAEPVDRQWLGYGGGSRRDHQVLQVRRLH